MQRPRCGNPDLGTVNSVGRPVNIDKPESSPVLQGRSMKGKTPESFVTQTNIWPKKHLKWFIEDYPEQQKKIKSKEHIRQIFNQSFMDWENYLGILALASAQL